MERDNLYNSVFENNQPSVINIDDEEEGEDLFNDNYMVDYKLKDGHDHARENRNRNLLHDNDNFFVEDAAEEEEVVLQITGDEHDEEEEDGEDLFNDNFLDDYRHMDGHE
ncbi:putative DNA replication licensing factor Mcm2 [Arabidopsis thaliana]